MWAVYLISVLPYWQETVFILYRMSLRIHYRNGIDDTKIVLEGKKKILIWIIVLPNHLAAAPDDKNILRLFRQGFYSSGAYLGQDDLSLPFDERPLVVECEYARLHLAPGFFVTWDEPWFVLSILCYPWWREAGPVLRGLWFLKHKDKYAVFISRLYFSLFLFLPTAVTVTGFGFPFLFLFDGG